LLRGYLASLLDAQEAGAILGQLNVLVCAVLEVVRQFLKQHGLQLRLCREDYLAMRRNDPNPLVEWPPSGQH